ncbi:MAG: hypothetical protein WCO66_05195 [Candidatus Absconditabacteria bacterium]
MFASRQVTHAEDTPFYYDTQKIEATTDLAKVIKENNISDSSNTNNQNSLLYKIRGYFQLNGTTAYDSTSPATEYVKNLLNMALGFVSFISLILVIFAFYLILFDKGEDGVKKAKKILTGVAIAIALMGLSWIIVGFFFNLYTAQAVKGM